MNGPRRIFFLAGLLFLWSGGVSSFSSQPTTRKPTPTDTTYKPTSMTNVSSIVKNTTVAPVTLAPTTPAPTFLDVPDLYNFELENHTYTANDPSSGQARCICVDFFNASFCVDKPSITIPCGTTCPSDYVWYDNSGCGPAPCEASSPVCSKCPYASCLIAGVTLSCSQAECAYSSNCCSQTLGSIESQAECAVTCETCDCCLDNSCFLGCAVSGMCTLYDSCNCTDTISCNAAQSTNICSACELSSPFGTVCDPTCLTVPGQCSYFDACCVPTAAPTPAINCTALGTAEVASQCSMCADWIDVCGTVTFEECTPEMCTFYEACCVTPEPSAAPTQCVSTNSLCSSCKSAVFDGCDPFCSDAECSFYDSCCVTTVAPTSCTPNPSVCSSCQSSFLPCDAICSSAECDVYNSCCVPTPAPVQTGPTTTNSPVPGGTNGPSSPPSAQCVSTNPICTSCQSSFLPCDAVCSSTECTFYDSCCSSSNSQPSPPPAAGSSPGASPPPGKPPAPTAIDCATPPQSNRAICDCLPSNTFGSAGCSTTQENWASACCTPAPVSSSSFFG